jgi:hypothetical protein
MIDTLRMSALFIHGWIKGTYVSPGNWPGTPVQNKQRLITKLTSAAPRARSTRHGVLRESTLDCRDSGGVAFGTCAYRNISTQSTQTATSRNLNAQLFRDFPGHVDKPLMATSVKQCSGQTQDSAGSCLLSEHSSRDS